MKRITFLAAGICLFLLPALAQVKKQKATTEQEKAPTQKEMLAMMKEAKGRRYYCEAAAHLLVITLDRGLT
ncbi:hypothetical protein [uncultured Chitinophaga sp.]|uniref:hypothetical protein n=1 Tax=uncultured Chitinophaga sp. TaxID=339340 RepID=UPI0025D8E708|nr:hypothetical protein [uncultured Chitinophaga sp.]